MESQLSKYFEALNPSPHTGTLFDFKLKIAFVFIHISNFS